MANTYVLIASNTLSSSAASVTFSSIPGTYTDLVLKCSVRTDRGATFDNMNVELNANTSAIYSETRLSGDGASASSSRSSGNSNFFSDPVNGDTATSNTFSNGEFYIPSYTASQNKQISGFGVNETNATTAYMSARAYLFRSTTAVTSIKFTPLNGTNFVSGSSFWLYGISNS